MVWLFFKIRRCFQCRSVLYLIRVFYCVLDTRAVSFSCAVVFEASCTTHRDTTYYQALPRLRLALSGWGCKIIISIKMDLKLFRFQPLEVHPRVCDSCRDQICGPRRIRTFKTLYYIFTSEQYFLPSTSIFYRPGFQWHACAIELSFVWAHL